MDPSKTGYPTAYGQSTAAYPTAPASYYPPKQEYPAQADSAGGFVNQSASYPPDSGYSQPPPPYNPNDSAPKFDSDPESQLPDNFGASFSDKAIRMRFIQRVYLILTCQLSVTVGFICLFIFHDGVKSFVQSNIYLYIIAYVVFLVTYISLVCCTKLRMKFPTNFILLAIFTLAMSYMVAMISSFHKTEIVLYTMGICAACCLCVSVFAIQTRFDFTKLGGVLFVVFLVVFFFGILAIIMRNKVMTMVYSGLIALVFMAFLAYDTQLVIGGKNRKFTLSPEEYINGALQLYMDVIQIFLALLSLAGDS